MAEKGNNKVLMICYHYPPIQNGGVERSVKFARFLPLYGWEPIVITTNRFGEPRAGDETVVRTGELFEGLRGRKGISKHSSKLRSMESTEDLKSISKQSAVSAIKTGVSGGVRIKGLSHWTRAIVKDVLSRFMIPDSHILWTFKAYKKAKELIRNDGIDLIYSSSPPVSSHLLAKALKMATGKPWVMDMRDPWTLEPIEKHLAGSGVRMSIERRMEKSCFELADCIVVNTEEVAREYGKIYGNRSESLAVITNGYDEDEMNEAKRLETEGPIVERNDGRFVISHLGSFSRYRYRDDYPASFLEAVRSLVDDGTIRSSDMDIFFVGENSAHAIERMESYNLGRMLHILPSVPHIDALRFMVSSDALLVFDPNPSGRLYIRGKVYEYLAAGKQILAVAPKGQMAELIMHSGAGIVCGPHNVECIREALTKLASSDTILAPFVFSSGVDLQGFERKVLAGKLADCMNKVVSSKKES